jgi:hypothetical protein
MEAEGLYAVRIRGNEKHIVLADIFQVAESGGYADRAEPTAVPVDDVQDRWPPVA